MFANNHISTLIESQLPDFIRSADAQTTAADANAPTFTKLLKKYYEYLEQDTKTLQVAKSLYDYADVDETRADLLKFFKSKFIPNFPEETELSTAKVIKAARDFYAKKGTPDSFKFIFRVLYNQEVDVFFPKEDILKASDGKWKLPQAIRLAFSDTLRVVSTGNVWVNVATPKIVDANGINLVSAGITANSFIQIDNEKRQVNTVNALGDYLTVYHKFNANGNVSGHIYDSERLYKVTLSEYDDFNVSLLNRRQGIGETSRTTCTIEKAIRTVDKTLGREIVEVYVSNVKRLFDAGENLVVEYVDENGLPKTFSSKIISVISNLSIFRNRFGIFQLGTKYESGDPVVIYGGLADTPEAAKAIATVGNVSTGSLETLSVVDRGYYFRDYPNSYVRIFSTSGVGANVLVGSILTDGANSDTFAFCTDAVGYKYSINLINPSGYDFDNVTARANLTAGVGNSTLAVNLNTATYTANTTNDYYKSYNLKIVAGTGSDGSGANVNTSEIISYSGTNKIASLAALRAVKGTVNVSIGSTTVTGNTTPGANQTYFIDDAIPGTYSYLTGKQISIDGEVRNVVTVSSNSSLTVDSPFTITRQNYKLYANSQLTVAPDGTSNVLIFASDNTQIGRAFSYDSILLGRIGTLELEDGGSFFTEVPTFDVESLYDTDYSIEQSPIETPWEIAGADYDYNKALKRLTLNSSNASFSTSNGFYTGTRVFLDVGDTAHYAKVTDYIVYDVATTPIKYMFLDREFENNINQTNIKNFRMFFDVRPSVKGIGKIGKVILRNGGTGYGATDKVEFIGTGCNANAYLTVSSGVITGITLDDRGEGYSEMPSIRILDSSNTLSSGTGAIFDVYGLSDGEDISAETDEIGKILDFNIISRGFDYANTPVVSLKIVDVLTNDLSQTTIVSGGEAVWQGGATNTGATFTGTIDDVHRENTTHSIIRVFDFSGTINTAEPLKINTATSNVTVTVLSQNANVSFAGINPKLEKPYPRYYGDGLAKANAEFLRGLIKYEGFYLNTDGFISADKKIQNNDYYHNFSYEIQSEKSLDDYNETIKRVAHPAGMQLLSKFLLKNSLDGEISTRANVHTSNSIQSTNANTSYLSNVFYGNNSSFTTRAAVGDLVLINTTETAEGKRYTRAITNIVDGNTIWLENPIGGVGDGRMNVRAGNANVHIFANGSAITESIEANSNITFMVGNTSANTIATRLPGTVNVSGTTVTGNLSSPNVTYFTTNLAVGSIISVNNQLREVVSISDDSSLTVNLAFTNANDKYFWANTAVRRKVNQVIYSGANVTLNLNSSVAFQNSNGIVYFQTPVYNTVGYTIIRTSV
jgi:hypothetical protein